MRSGSHTCSSSGHVMVMLWMEEMTNCDSSSNENCLRNMGNLPTNLQYIFLQSTPSTSSRYKSRHCHSSQRHGNWKATLTGLAPGRHHSHSQPNGSSVAAELTSSPTGTTQTVKRIGMDRRLDYAHQSSLFHPFLWVVFTVSFLFLGRNIGCNTDSTLFTVSCQVLGFLFFPIFQTFHSARSFQVLGFISFPFFSEFSFCHVLSSLGPICFPFFSVFFRFFHSAMSFQVYADWGQTSYLGSLHALNISPTPLLFFSRPFTAWYPFIYAGVACKKIHMADSIALTNATSSAGEFLPQILPCWIAFQKLEAFPVCLFAKELAPCGAT